MENEVTPFENKAVRKVLYNEQWYFSVVDIINVLTDTNNPNRYWTDLKRRSEKESGQSYDFCVSLKLKSKDGKSYKTDCANTEGVFRIIQSITSPKAEPFKLWLAEQGKRTLEEINDPSLLTERQAEYYRLKGYDEDWIKQRVKNITVRNELTDEWQKRGIKEGTEYSILTATISKGTFGITPSEHAKLKGLENENLRDHMTNLELLLTSLGEEVTKEIAKDNDAKGFNENHEAAVKGGQAGRNALKGVEKQIGRKVLSKDNFKHLKGGEPNKTIETKEE